MASILDGLGGAPRPVVAYADSKGVRTDFVADEVIFSPKDAQDLTRFLELWGGTVVADDAVPEPPAELNMPPLTAEQKTPNAYTIRVTKFPETATLPAEGTTRQMQGPYVFSSDLAVRLIALTAHENNAGARISPNWVYTPSDMLWKTREAPDGNGGNLNAFDWGPFKGGPSLGGNHSTIYAAWQFLHAHGYTPFSVRVAVIDGGFWVDGNGTPNSTPGIGTDLSPHPSQYDFIAGTANVAGVNPANCTGGSTCNWHGNGSASVAMGFVDNQAAAAGAGGLVAKQMLFKVNMTFAAVRWAIRTLPAWGAQVANMSFGGSCNDDCVDYKDDTHYYSYMQDAYDYGTVLVAAAGNDATNVVGDNIEPCMIGGVICVGALDDNKNTAISYSNFGDGVDIWAPTDIPAMPNGDFPNALTIHSGTSASAPLVAGVAAMMKAMDPSLNSDYVYGILHATANGIIAGSDKSKDPKVQAAGYMNAWRAVITAAKKTMPDDAFAPNHTLATATPLAPGVYENLTLQPSTSEFYRFDLSDYSNFSLELTYVYDGLGYVWDSLQVPGPGQAKVTSMVDKGTDTGSVYSGFIPPGTYYWQIGSNYPQAFNMNFTATATGLPKDGFEINDTLGQAALADDGTYPVTLHQDTDVDYYRFTCDAPTGLFADHMYYQVEIRGADFPVHFSVANAAGTTEYYSIDGTDGSYKAFIPVDWGKTFIARVSGPKARYQLSLGNHLPADIFLPPLTYDPNVWDQKNPFKGILVNPEDWVVFVVDPDTSAFIMPDQGLSLSLYDTSSTKLGEGAPVSSAATTGTVLRLDLKSLALQSGKAYLLRIARQALGDAPTDTPDGLGQVSAATPYEVAVSQ